jgi:HD-like signal output (HDOD) protein
LLHDVGKLVLATSLPWRYEQTMAAVKQRHLPVWQAEREVFGSSHGEVGAYLLGLWGLPDSLVEAVAFHHDPHRTVHHGFNALTSVHLANALTLQKSPSRSETEPPLNQEYLDELQIAANVPEWQNLATELGK